MIDEKPGAEEKLISDLVHRINSQVCHLKSLKGCAIWCCLATSYPYRNAHIVHILSQVRVQKPANGYQTAEQISLEQIKKKDEEALIHLSANKLNMIVSGLAEGLDALSKVMYKFSYAAILPSM